MKAINLRTSKKRIRFLGNFQKITQSISLISVIEFQRSHSIIQKIIKNVFYLLSIFSEVYKRHKEVDKFLKEKFGVLKEGKKLIVVISSDRGLAGAFDKIIFEKAEEVLAKEKDFYLGVIGLKAERYFEPKHNLIFKISRFERFDANDFAKLLNEINLLLNQKEISQIVFVRPNLISLNFFVEVLNLFPFNLENLNQLIEKIIPSTKEFEELKKESEEFKWDFEYILEPSPEILVEKIIEQAFYLVLYALILQAQASLTLTRTITMKRASENAQKLQEQAIIIFNKLRQAKITEELMDIQRIK